MSSPFVSNYQTNYCFGSNNNVICSKPQFEVPKQLLQLRTKAKQLAQHNHQAVLLETNSSTGALSSLAQSPQTRTVQKNPKLHLSYIEKDKRVRQMIPQHQQYQAYDRPISYLPRKVTPGGQSNLMRTPSSGFSSASSSENMLSGLSLNDNGPKLTVAQLIAYDDPTVETDLDYFLMPEVRYKQPTAPSTSMSRANLSQISGPSQNGGCMRQIAPSQAKNSMPTPFQDFSYSNIKRSSGYIDFMPAVFNASTATQQCAPLGPMSSMTCARCNYCWKTYVELCQRVTNLDPMISCDGPWHWHSLYDAQGRVTCPRLWFAQLDRAGSDMIEQMGNVRNVPV